MDVLTIAEAAQTTGWSARMLRYIEQTGLVVPRRSEGGYRLYGPAQVQRLRTLRALVRTYDIGLAELAFVARLRSEPDLGAAVGEWFDTRPTRPADTPDTDWLRFEQEKHERLLTMPPARRRSLPIDGALTEPPARRRSLRSCGVLPIDGALTEPPAPTPRSRRHE